jgi:hypothetical protein
MFPLLPCNSATRREANRPYVYASHRYWKKLKRRLVLKTISSLRSQRLGAAAFLLVLPVLAPAGASAQLIDPNNQCIYQPGSTECQPIAAPELPPVSGAPYDQFVALAEAFGVDMSQHPSYSEGYFYERANIYCSLLQQQDANRILIQLLNVASVWEPNGNFPKIERAILRVAALNYCPAYYADEQPFEATYSG